MNTDDSRIIARFQRLTTELLAQKRLGQWHPELVDELYRTSLELEQRGLKKTPEYRNAMVQADEQAWRLVEWLRCSCAANCTGGAAGCADASHRLTAGCTGGAAGRVDSTNRFAAGCIGGAAARVDSTHRLAAGCIDSGRLSPALAINSCGAWCRRRAPCQVTPAAAD